MRVDLTIPDDPTEYPFRHPVRVRFAETDAMGVVHHAAYVPLMEEGRAEYLRHLGHPYSTLRDEGIDLAVLELVARYLRPARFEDLVEVHVRAGRFRGATFQIDYLLTVDGDPCLVGATVHGVVDARGRATRAPAWFKDLLGGLG